jgi:hypothetical protein
MEPKLWWPGGAGSWVAEAVGDVKNAFEKKSEQGGALPGFSFGLAAPG